MPEIIYSGPEGRLEGRINVVENKLYYIHYLNSVET